MTLSVYGSNDKPVLKADVYTVSEDVTLTLSAAQGVIPGQRGARHGHRRDRRAQRHRCRRRHGRQRAQWQRRRRGGGLYGSLTLAADGSAVYRPGNKAQTLKAGQSASDVFSYAISDGHGGVAFTTVSFTLQGANDVPLQATSIPDQVAVIGAGYNYVVPAGGFTDADLGDTLSFSATQADGSALPAWLTFNAGTRTFSGTPAARRCEDAEPEAHRHRCGRRLRPAAPSSCR